MKSTDGVAPPARGGGPHRPRLASTDYRSGAPGWPRLRLPDAIPEARSRHWRPARGRRERGFTRRAFEAEQRDQELEPLAEGHAHPRGRLGEARAQPRNKGTEKTRSCRRAHGHGLSPTRHRARSRVRPSPHGRAPARAAQRSPPAPRGASDRRIFRGGRDRGWRSRGPRECRGATRNAGRVRPAPTPRKRRAAGSRARPAVAPQPTPPGCAPRPRAARTGGAPRRGAPRARCCGKVAADGAAPEASVRDERRAHARARSGRRSPRPAEDAWTRSYIQCLSIWLLKRRMANPVPGYARPHAQCIAAPLQ